MHIDRILSRKSEDMGIIMMVKKIKCIYIYTLYVFLFFLGGKLL